jgi:hypothetical protein
MALPYYFTLDVANKLKVIYQRNAQRQEEFIYEMFKTIPNATRAEIIEMFEQINVRISTDSIGRSLSNLVDRLKIYPTDEKRVGNWGKDNSVYALVTNENIEEAEAKWNARKVGIKFTRTELEILEMVLTDFNKNNNDFDPIVYKTVSHIISLLNTK